MDKPRAMGLFERLAGAGPVLRDAISTGNFRLLASMLGPAFRGLVLRNGRRAPGAQVPVGYPAHFDWSYERERPDIARLYQAGKAAQWDASTDLDWTTDVDPLDPERALLPDAMLPMAALPQFARLSPEEKAAQRHGVTAWMLSQFLHGEQGGLYAAAQVAESMPTLDGKLCAGQQVADEARHLEVFHSYLTRKLEKRYHIDDNLYVVVDAVMSDPRWDMKLLGMQVVLEGAILGAFGLMRGATREPLLKQLLTSVIGDEARHVRFGVIALREHIAQLSERERREREDWAFEMASLIQNRFLAHEFHEEHWAHALTRAQWDALVLDSSMMAIFRRGVFERMVPNLRSIGLLSERVHPRYARIGLLQYAGGRAATELTTQELLA